MNSAAKYHKQVAHEQEAIPVHGCFFLYAQAKKFFIVWVLLCAMSVTSVAQTEELGKTDSDTLSVQLIQQELIYSKLPWLYTSNAASLAYINLPTLGNTSFSASHEEGDFHRAQQPVEVNRLMFQSERYQKVKQVSLYANFKFAQQMEKDVWMTDVLNPYRGTPYLLADSVGGDWSKQQYALHLKVASAKLAHDKLSLGTSLSYTNTTGARQNDPRPLNYSNELKIAPSLIYQLDPHQHIGVTGSYESYREEVSIEIRETGAYHRIYRMFGLGEYQMSTFSSGAGRVYNGKTFGGDVQYGYERNSFSSITQIGYHSGKDDATEGTSSPRPVGTFKQNEINANSVIQFRSKLNHQLNISYTNRSMTGIGYHIYYNSTTLLWETVLEAPFYKGSDNDVLLSYQLLKPLLHKDYQWLLRASVKYQSMIRKYLYPVSNQSIDRISYQLEAGKNIVINQSDLKLRLQLSYRSALNEKLEYRPMTTTSNLVGNEILLPDHDYLSASVMGYGLTIQYVFKELKKSKVRFYIDANARNEQRTNATALDNGYTGSRMFTSLALGFVY